MDGESFSKFDARFFFGFVTVCRSVTIVARRDFRETERLPTALDFGWTESTQNDEALPRSSTGAIAKA
jgi:hypothetical protein